MNRPDTNLTIAARRQHAKRLLRSVKLAAPEHGYFAMCLRLISDRRLDFGQLPDRDTAPRVRIALRPYQQEIFDDRSSGILILHWSRQIGKSFTLAAWAVDRLLTRPGRLVTVLSNSRENGAEFVAKCAEVCRLNGTEYTSVDKSQGLRFQNMRMEVRIRAEGKTGRIKVLAANPRTARGFSGDLILDEFAFHEDSAAIWEAAEPILASNPDFLCRIASTGNGKHNLFYRMTEGKISPRSEVQSPKSGGELGDRLLAIGDGKEAAEIKQEATETTEKELSVLSVSSCSNPDRLKSEVQSPKSGGELGDLPLAIGDSKQEPEVEKAETKQEATQTTEQEISVISVSSCSNPDLLKSEVQSPTSAGELGDGKEAAESKQEATETTEQEISVLSVSSCSNPDLLKSEVRSPKSEGELGDRLLPIGDGKEAAETKHEATQTTELEISVLSVSSCSNPDRLNCKGVLTGPEISKSRTGFPVSRITRTQAHAMGVKLYDANTRAAVSPDEARAQALDKRAYDQNYECVFADENATLLSHELINAAEREDVGVICEQDWSSPPHLNLNLNLNHSPLASGFVVHGRAQAPLGGPDSALESLGAATSPHSDQERQRASSSPSPGGEGWGEGELSTLRTPHSALEFLRSATGPLFVGFDVARKGDLSVITVMEDLNGTKIVRAILRMQNLRLPEQQQRLGEICRLPKFRRAAIDMTGLGLGLFEYAQQEFGSSRIHGINFATSVPATRAVRLEGRPREMVRVTEAMAMELLQTYEDRRIQHPADNGLRDDLRKAEKVTTPGGRVSIAATRDEAGHADHFWSFALALEAASHGGGGTFAYQAVERRRPRWYGF